MMRGKHGKLVVVMAIAILVLSMFQSPPTLVPWSEIGNGQATILGNNVFTAYNFNETTGSAATSSSSQASFLLPKTNEFRPVTQLRRNDECKPDFHQPLNKVSTPFDNYANATRFFNLSSDSRNGPLVCQFTKDQPYFTHFAHSMQQLYGCYSFYQQHKDQGIRTKILIMPPKVRSKLMSNSFLQGFLGLLEEEMRVEIISPSAFQQAYPEAVNVSVASEIFVRGGYIISHARELNQLAQQYISKTNIPEASVESGSLCGTMDYNDSVVYPRIGILNRRPAVGRSIRNAANLVKALANFSLHRRVQLEYFEERSFFEQVQFYQRTDILLSPHGAQLTGLPFLANGDHECGQLLELFPPNYLIPEFFGSLARNSDIGYSYLYLSSNMETHPSSTEQRVKSRAANLCPSVDVIQHSIQNLVADWRKCCHHVKE